MRRYSGGLVSRRSRGAVAPAAALVAAALLAAAAAPAGATITPITHDDAGGLDRGQRGGRRGLSRSTPQGAGLPARAAERQSGRHRGRGKRAARPFPRDGDDVPRALDGRRDAGRPARPGRDCSRASTTVGRAHPAGAATAASTSTVLQIPFNPGRRPARAAVSPSTSASCPRSTRAARQRLQRRLHRRARQRSTWTTSGPSDHRRPRTSPRPDRPAADDQVDGAPIACRRPRPPARRTARRRR